MKRTLSILLVLALVAALFVGCAGKDNKDNKKPDAKNADTVVGTYKVKTMNGKTLQQAMEEEAEASGMTVEEMMEDLPDGVTLDNLIVLTIKDGGAASIAMYGVTVDGTWTQDGNNLTITIGDEPMEATYANGEITIEDDGTTIVFAK